MTIARRLRWYLDHCGASYEVTPHPIATSSSRQTAAAAHVPEARLAKSVLVEDERGYVLVVVPASRRLDLHALDRELGRRFELASERELSEIFSDCAIGAVPPFGAAYGIPTVFDEALLHHEDVYFDAGDHQELVRTKTAEFAHLMRGARSGDFSRGSDEVPAREPIRERGMRTLRLDDEKMHVFSLRSYGAGLRRQPEYEAQGHTGMILVKTPELRMVLEAIENGVTLRSHVIHGPATIFVLEGGLDVSTRKGSYRVGESEMAVLPRDEKREISAAGRSLFVLGLAPNGPAEVFERVPSELQPEAGRQQQKIRRVLVIANRTVGGTHLKREVQERMEQGPCQFTVICPAVPSTSGLSYDEKQARVEAQSRLDHACRQLRELGAEVEGMLGDRFAMRAARDVLLTHDFDEIIVSTLPTGASQWLRMDLPHRIARRFDLPVTHVASTG